MASRRSIDTSVVIDVEKVDLGEYVDCAVVVSAVTVGELAYGIGAGDRDAREQRLRRVLASYEIVPFGVEEAKFYGVLAELVRIAGRNPGHAGSICRSPRPQRPPACRC